MSTLADLERKLQKYDKRELADDIISVYEGEMGFSEFREKYSEIPFDIKQSLLIPISCLRSEGLNKERMEKLSEILSDENFFR